LSISIRRKSSEHGRKSRPQNGPETEPKPELEPGVNAALPAVNELKESIRAKAHELGFDAVGFASAAGTRQDRAHLEAFIAEGRHGDMEWMATTAERRGDPRALWPEARSLIALGLNYGPATDPMSQIGYPDRAAISVYAQGRDYHKVIKARLKVLGRWLADTFACDVKAFVDTAPLMEKPAAMRAGIGWTGKHTNLVSRRFGSWLFLGEVLTTLPIPPDPPEVDHCGSCEKCLKACPTGALTEPYRIDPRRCISYLTIEHKGTIEEDLQAAIGNRVYGCDDCLAACPWTKFASATMDADLLPRPQMAAPRLADLAALDDAAFRTLTTGSAVRRTGRERFVRNVLIAIGNSGANGNNGGSSLAAVTARLTDASPLVREAAAWALKRIAAGQLAAQSPAVSSTSSPGPLRAGSAPHGDAHSESA
jgi:epoxyqueuosine reductase